MVGAGGKTVDAAAADVTLPWSVCLNERMTSVVLRQTWGLGAAGPPEALGYGARAPEPGIHGWLQRRSPEEAAHTEALTADALQRLLSLEV